MNTITFGNDRYHEHLEMEQWCHKNIGAGGWTYGIPRTWENLGDNIWIINSIFGNTTFAFKDEKHLSIFILRWG